MNGPPQTPPSPPPWERTRPAERHALFYAPLAVGRYAITQYYGGSWGGKKGPLWFGINAQDQDLASNIIPGYKLVWCSQLRVQCIIL